MSCKYKKTNYIKMSTLPYNKLNNKLPTTTKATVRPAVLNKKSQMIY